MLRAESNFGVLDFPTRDQYRRAIEELARGSNRSEIEVTRLALLATKRAANDAQDVASARKRDPGYYLIAKGRPAFESMLGFHVTIKGWLVAPTRRSGFPAILAE